MSEVVPLKIHVLVMLFGIMYPKTDEKVLLHNSKYYIIAKENSRLANIMMFTMKPIKVYSTKIFRLICLIETLLKRSKKSAT